MSARAPQAPEPVPHFPDGGFRRVAGGPVIDVSASSLGARNPRLFIEGGTFYVYTDCTPAVEDTAVRADVKLWSGPSLTELTAQGTMIANTALTAQVGDANPYVQAGGIVKSGDTYHTWVCATNEFSSSMAGGGIYHVTAPAPTGPWTYADTALTGIGGERAPLDNSTPVYFNGQWVMAFMSYLTAYPTRTTEIATAASLDGPWTRQNSLQAQGGYSLGFDGPELYVENDRLWMVYTVDDWANCLYDVTDLEDAYYYGVIAQSTSDTAESGAAGWGRGGVYRDPSTGRLWTVYQARATGGYYKVFGAEWYRGKTYVAHHQGYFVNGQAIAGGGSTYALPSGVPDDALFIDVMVEIEETGALQAGAYVVVDHGYDNYMVVLRPNVEDRVVGTRALLPYRPGVRTIRARPTNMTTPKLYVTLCGYWRMP
jgi:hypothetical protein